MRDAKNGVLGMRPVYFAGGGGTSGCRGTSLADGAVGSLLDMVMVQHCVLFLFCTFPKDNWVTSITQMSHSGVSLSIVYCIHPSTREDYIVIITVRPNHDHPKNTVSSKKKKKPHSRGGISPLPSLQAWPQVSWASPPVLA
jgi:hypothetical protein